MVRPFRPVGQTEITVVTSRQWASIGWNLTSGAKLATRANKWQKGANT